jgi:hypothetical protein
MRGSLRCATDDTTVRRSGRDDGVNEQSRNAGILRYTQNDKQKKDNDGDSGLRLRSGQNDGEGGVAGKVQIRGSLRCATDDTTVRRSGRDDGVKQTAAGPSTTRLTMKP